MWNSILFKTFFALFVFSAIAQVETAEDDCNEFLDESEGNLHTPNYPNKYGNSMTCTWQISVAPGSQVALRFQSFQVEGGNRCQHDYVEVRDGLGVHSNLLSRLCGSFIPKEIRSTSNHMLVSFKSDESHGYSGFLASYTTVKLQKREADIPSLNSIVKGVREAKENLTEWFLERRKDGSTTNKWGHQLPRIATALYLADKRFFSPGNKTGDEMSYELTIQLLSRMSGKGRLNSNELATYIHALLVACIDPRNFHGRDLVFELRGKVESSNYTNPFDILVLCNAGDKMTLKDVERISAVYDSHYLPFWTDMQAMSTIALACVSARSDLFVDERTLKDMAQELKKRQFKNGTVDDLKTTALVMQALIATQSDKRDFDYDAAIKVILLSQKINGSFYHFLEEYYILPVLSNTSLLNITSEHCQRPSTSEEEALSELQRAKVESLSTHYSVWIGNDIYLRRSWTLKVPVNSSLYDIIEKAQTLDSRHRVEYNVIDGKPFVSTLSGIQNDIEMGLYWFTYVQTQSSEGEPKLVEESPVDIKIHPNQELILWYKAGVWNGPSSSSGL